MLSVSSMYNFLDYLVGEGEFDTIDAFIATVEEDQNKDVEYCISLLQVTFLHRNEFIVSWEKLLDSVEELLDDGSEDPRLVGLSRKEV